VTDGHNRLTDWTIVTTVYCRPITMMPEEEELKKLMQAKFCSTNNTVDEY